MNDDMTPEEESPHITTLRNQHQLGGRRKAKFRIVDGKVESYEDAAPVQDVEERIAAARAAEKRAILEAYKKKMDNAEIGYPVEGSGIYLGTFTITDRKGSGLSKTFNIFAAPENLKDESSGKNAFGYNEALKRVSELRNWHGHDGTTYRNDKGIYAALANGSYAGGWIIPPRELLVGTETAATSGPRTSTVVQPDNLYDHRDKGVLKGTLANPSSSSIHAVWYWSSTERPNDQHLQWNVKFENGNGAWNSKTQYSLSCRLVRLEPKP